MLTYLFVIFYKKPRLSAGASSYGDKLSVSTFHFNSAGAWLPFNIQQLFLITKRIPTAFHQPRERLLTKKSRPEQMALALLVGQLEMQSL